MLNHRMIWKTAVDRRCLAAIILLPLAMTGCGNPIRHKVEAGIRDNLPKLIGPAKSYQVSVSGSPLGMMKGKLRSMKIVGTDVRLPSGMEVSQLVVNSTDIAFDQDRHVLSRVASTCYSVTLAESVLNDYLLRTYPRVPSLKAELNKNLLHVAAAPEIAGVQLHIEADAALGIRSNRCLILDLKSVKVAGIGTPEFAREYLESKVNPVFDVASLGYDAKVTGVAIRPNALTIEGTLDLAKVIEH